MPFVPQDLLDRINALEREVRQLRGRAQMRPAMDKITNGRVVIGEGGTLEVLAPNGTGLFGVGEFGPGWAHPDGTPQQGTLMQREDGTTAFSIRANPAPPGSAAPPQAVSIWDRTGHIVMGDDTTSGRGIGSPALPMPFQPLPAANEVITVNSFVSCWFASVPRQNPVAEIHLELAAAAGATCEAKIQYRLASESTWSDMATDTVTGPAGSSGLTYKTAWHRFPLHRAAWEQDVFIRIQGRQRSGTAGVRVSCLGGYTRRTYGPSEIPTPPTSAVAAASPVDTPPAAHGVERPGLPPADV
ncbi:hypothetical protein ACWEV4_02360 [Streptomyces sp. NPDC003860]